MENFEEIELVDKIKKEKCVTFNTIENYFSGKNFKEIRDWLEIHNIYRHIAIELKSAGVIILISNNNKEKVLLQVRANERARLGIFGGGIESNETPIKTAISELREETGIEIKKEQLDFLEINEHDIEYENGDKVHYTATL